VSANWENDKYKDHMHDLMNRTMDALEEAVRGIGAESEPVARLALPLIDKDRQR